MANYAPVGWTPIGLSLERAGQDFPSAADNVVNAVILVTDGLETCDSDPCAIATSIKESDAAITAYVVGLGLDEEELRITSCIAENTGGQIVGAQNAEELSAALFTFLEELEVVVTTGHSRNRIDETRSATRLSPAMSRAPPIPTPRAASRSRSPYRYLQSGRAAGGHLRGDVDQSKRPADHHSGQHRA